MDAIRQYQKLSNIKPLFQKLTMPLYSVSSHKLDLNKEDIILVHEGLGLYREKPKKENKPRSKRGGYDQPVLVANLEMDSTDY